MAALMGVRFYVTATLLWRVCGTRVDIMYCQDPSDPWDRANASLENVINKTAVTIAEADRLSCGRLLEGLFDDASV